MTGVFKYRNKWATILLPIFILGIVFFFATMNQVYTKSYDIERFNRAKETIRSPVTVVNEVETERKVRETLQAVGDRYTISEDITEERVNYIDEIFDAFDKLNEIRSEDNKSDGEKEEKNIIQALTYDEVVVQLQEILSQEITDSLSDLTLYELMRIDIEEREKAKKVLLQAMEKTLNNGVRLENMNSAKEEVRNTLKYSHLDEEAVRVFNDLIDFSIVENSFYDADKTMEARTQAANNIEPVTIRAGDVIVREGQVITNEMYEDIKLVGLLKEQRNLFPGTGLALFILILMGIIAYELNRLDNRADLSHAKIVAIILIGILVVSAMKVVSIFSTEQNFLYLLVPIATGVLLIKLLLFERLSIVFAIVFSILGSIIFNGDIPGTMNVEVGLYYLFFQLSGIFLLTNLRDRLSLVKATAGMAIVNVMSVIMFTLLSFQTFNLIDSLTQIAFAFVAAIIVAILTTGLLPIFETGLGVLSDNKLLSLANPNQPLIRKILTEAPGTYHHSVMVANLSEAACEAVGANGLLARVGSYYHDIGKTIQPHYFIENQVAIKNPHDFIEPDRSAEIIISHVTEGVKMLQEHNLPREIVDIAMQHHGTSLVEYFYFQAKQKSDDVKEIDFRYPGPKPQSKEAAIISICDSVEAAVRSLREPSPEKIEEIVQSIMNNRLMDGQFEETPLTFSDLKIVQVTICEALKGIFHSRIQYPTKEE